MILIQSNYLCLHFDLLKFLVGFTILQVVFVTQSVTKKKPYCWYKNFNTAYFDTLQIVLVKVLPLQVNAL